MGERPIRFGLQLRSAAGGAAWVAMAREAEDAGFATISMSDHFGDQFAPLVALGAVAVATSDIRLTMEVLCNDFRNPAVLAKEIATLDCLSDGRCELGLGAGWLAAEYKQAGLAFDGAGTRIDRLAETVGVLRRLFDGETVTHEGPHVQVVDLELHPKPVQARLPILLGGGGRRMVTLAAQQADVVGIMTDNRSRTGRPGWHPNATWEAAATSVGWVREGAGTRFDQLELRTRVLMQKIGGDRETAAARIGRQAGLTTEEVLRSPYALIGSPQEVADHVRRVRDEMGISSFTVSGHLARNLAPVVAELAGR